MTSADPNSTAPQEPTNAPGRAAISVEGRYGADAVSGSNEFISWGARSDVGLVRGHNEDSFLLRTPLFAVCDGMGGHAAGEVASSIAVETIGNKAPGTADDVLLGAAVEAANLAVIEGAEQGIGKPGMGCTASAVIIEGNKMAVAHVGDSRVYLLRHGTLVRVTHDHSFVEELVDSGQITADEARTHPSRSIITRALGSDPDMYADHFSLEVSNGDRIIVCSDGLSGMVPDSEIESLAVSSATPQQAADNLVSAALTAGGSDNVTVLVIDVNNDGLAAASRKRLFQRIATFTGIILAVLAAVVIVAILFVRSQWYLGENGDTVGIYHGVNAEVCGLSLSELVGTSSVQVDDLPEAIQSQLEEGIRVDSEDAAYETINSYREQIDADKTRAAEIAENASTESETSSDSGDEGTDAADETDTLQTEETDETSTENGGE